MQSYPARTIIVIGTLLAAVAVAGETLQTRRAA